MNRKLIKCELSRICGWDNALLSYEIDTQTNKVKYRLQTYQRGFGASERVFDTYARAAEAFDNFGKMIHGGTAK